MSQDHKSGKFEDGSVLPKEKFQESMIFMRLVAWCPSGGEPTMSLAGLQRST